MFIGAIPIIKTNIFYRHLVILSLISLKHTSIGQNDSIHYNNVVVKYLSLGSGGITWIKKICV